MKKEMKTVIISIIIVLFSGLIILLILPLIQVGTIAVSLDLSSGEEVIEEKYFWGIINDKRFTKTIISENWEKMKNGSSVKGLYPLSKAEIYIGSKKYMSLTGGRIYYEMLYRCMETPDSTQNEITAFISQISSETDPKNH